MVADVLARAMQGYSKAVKEIEAIRKRRLLVAVLAAIVGTSFAFIALSAVHVKI